eukprot:scaffold38130_cov62-Phaeocystis_antarctica.AAC.4
MGEPVSFSTNAPGGMGRITPSSCASSFMTTPDSMAGRLALLMPPADAACSAAACPSGDRATHSAASSAVAKRPRATTLPLRLTRAW